MTDLAAASQRKLAAMKAVEDAAIDGLPTSRLWAVAIAAYLLAAAEAILTFHANPEEAE